MTLKVKKSSKKPTRSCISCGRKADQDELFRYTWQNGQPVLDTEKRRQGRGAYCCKKDVCQTGLMKNRKKWKRVFRLW